MTTAKKPPRHGMAWSVEEEAAAYTAFMSGVTIAEIAARHGRTTYSLELKLEKASTTPVPSGAPASPEYRPELPQPIALRQFETMADVETTFQSVLDDGLRLLTDFIDIACRDADVRGVDILVNRLALGDDHLSLAQLGTKYQVTRERIRQLEKRFIRRLRTRMNRHPVYEAFQKIGIAARQISGETGLYRLIGSLREAGLSDHVFRTFLLPLLALPAKTSTKRKKTAVAEIMAHYSAFQTDQRRQANRAFRDLRDQTRSEQWIDRLLECVDWPAGATTPDAGVLDRCFEDRFADLRHAHSTMLAPGSQDSDDRHDVQVIDSPTHGLLYYESRAELEALVHLGRSPRIARLVTQSLCLPYRLLGVDRRYFPDCVIRLADGRIVVLEIKDPRMLCTYAVLAKSCCARRRLAPAGIGYVLMSVDGGTCDTIAAQIVPPDAEAALLHDLVRKKTLDGWDIFDWCAQWKTSVLQFQAIVLRHKLYFRSYPFGLTRRPDLEDEVFADCTRSQGRFPIGDVTTP